MLDPQEDGPSDIPGYDGLEDEAFPPLPPPRSPGQEEGDPFADGDEGDVSALADVPATKRKGVRRPQPKLDSQRLISEKGLPALRTMFDDVRFKGKGREAEDLRLLMQKMENWAHRLYPKLQFEDFIDKVEKLGSKKEVQTCLKRIRLDMPLTHEDFMDGVEEAPTGPQVIGDPDPFSRVSFDDLQGPVHSTPAPTATAAPSPVAPSLSEEQRRRMELNRQRALERRLARQQQQQETDPSDSQTVDPPSPRNEPTSVSSANLLNDSADQDQKGEDLDPDPSSSTTQPPAAESEPPAAESEPPAAESEPPAAESEPPAAESEPPAAESEPPAAESEPPAAESEPPAAESEPPAAESEPPAAESEPPAETGQSEEGSSASPGHPLGREEEE
ncbi:TIMELESS-interacting protein [Odontesthes bonariensis]|uniref:TIMELESS-interacting protein n=1 Tax=Odontesthes bonariensis TaxID=219752 RepID=UPI003F5898D5